MGWTQPRFNGELVPALTDLKRRGFNICAPAFAHPLVPGLIRFAVRPKMLLVDLAELPDGFEGLRDEAIVQGNGAQNKRREASAEISGAGAASRVDADPFFRRAASFAAPAGFLAVGPDEFHNHESLEFRMRANRLPP